MEENRTANPRAFTDGAVFLGIWDILSKEIQTKSGKLPSPTETIGAAGSIQTFAKREDMKKSPTQ